MRKKWFLLLVMSALVFTGCSSDDDENTDDVQSAPNFETLTGIPDNSKAGESPVVTESTTSIPNMSFSRTEINGCPVVNMNMTGIFNNETGEWLDLVGTAQEGQNIWLEIDGQPRSIKVEKLADAQQKAKTRADGKPMADVVFLIDNSGSMYEEADVIANEIDSWSAKLEQILDLRLGCVGYDDSYISGGINMGSYTALSAFLNRPNRSGTYRTFGFVGKDSIALYDCTSDYRTYGECGAAALHFADKYFTFRPGANRIYINFTDEPNQPYASQPQYSVEYLNSQENWKAYQGTVHTVFSEPYYTTEYYTYWNENNEKPWLMSEYTGGSVLYATSDFSNVTLESLPVTGALHNSYSVSLYLTTDMETGTHTVKVTILSPDGAVKAVREFTDVTF